MANMIFFFTIINKYEKSLFNLLKKKLKNHFQIIKKFKIPFLT